jgi:hypothetical protein
MDERLGQLERLLALFRVVRVEQQQADVVHLAQTLADPNALAVT